MTVNYLTLVGETQEQIINIDPNLKLITSLALTLTFHVDIKSENN